MGILEINEMTGKDNYTFEYEITDYELGTKICDSSNTCKLGVSKEFYLTIRYKEGAHIEVASGYESYYYNDFKFEFNFQPAYNVTYEGITVNDYPTSVLEGDTLEVTFTSPIPKKVVPYINDVKVSNYTYENNKLTVENVTGDITLKYQEKAYLTTLSQGSYFKTSTYLSKIKTINFVDYIDIPSNALATYNLEENNGDEIKGWIDSNYNLYIGSEWDIYGKDLSSAFYNMSGVTSINFDNLNTSEATTMRYMFYNCSNLTSLDVSSFVTTSVTNMQYMFYNCKKLTTLNVKSFNTAKVTTMAYMFQNCSGLTSLDVSNFNTSKLTSLYQMFSGCSNLTTLNVSNFTNNLVTNFSYLFKDCTKLTNLNLTNFKTPSATNMNGMFISCKALTTLNLSSFNTSKVTSMANMFNSCTSLTSLDLTNFNTSKVTAMQTMFAYTSSLNEVLVSEENWIIGSSTNTTDLFGSSKISSVTKVSTANSSG